MIPEQLTRGLAFPEATRAGPVLSRGHLSQQEKIQEVLPSRRDEAHFHRGVSRHITSNIWNFQRVLHTLAATQEVPLHTRLHSRGSTRLPPTSRGAPFRLLARGEGSFQCVVGKEFPAFPSHLKRRRSPQERREELQGRATIPRVPQMSRPFQGNLFSLHCFDFQGEDRLTPRWLVGQPCGKASWASLEGKPRGKATDPLIHGKGSVTLLLPLGRKAHMHAPSRDED